MVTEKQKANLRPVKSKEEARERGANGGRKSGEKKRQLKTWKEILTKMLETPATESQVEKLKKYGIEDDDATIQSAILYQHILGKAITGDKWAIEKLAQITDNNGTQKIEVSANESQVAEDIGAFIDANRETNKHD